jgi:membrane associated rhomboid family serine protease
MLSKLPDKFHIPAAIVAGCGFIAVALAWALGPAESRGEIASAVGAVWAVVQALMPSLLREVK